MDEQKKVKITVVLLFHFFFVLLPARTAPSCICQQDVRCVHRCSEGASTSLTSLSLSPVTLTLGVSAQPQILSLTKTLSVAASLTMYSVCALLCILHCVVHTWPQKRRPHTASSYKV